MKNALLFSAALLVSVVAPSFAQHSSIFPKGEKSPNVHHTGSVWLNELIKSDSIFNKSIAVATFDPEARLDWHIHPGGQILLFTDGIGYYQEKGKPKQTFHKGDVVKCLPGIEHWHGATPMTGVTYLASSPTQKGKTIWLQKVTDEEYYGAEKTAANAASFDQEIINLSKKKWDWMADKNADSLAHLFHEKSVFVHMGGNWGKDCELEIIRSGGIHYKHAEIQETSVQFVGETAILLSKIRLDAVVGGNEVSNPFTVTEVFVLQKDAWSLASLSFTKLIAP